jgi:predicted ferric reductase
MTRIEVLAPAIFCHTPAQHCFLRSLAISLVDNHPFTIVSAPSLETVTAEGNERDAANGFNPQSLVFAARTRDGFTRRLADYCASHPDVLASARIDGPYGGLDRPIEQLYDQLIIVTGGSGITACVPWPQHILNKSSTVGISRLRVKCVVLHWIIVWVEKELRSISHGANGSNLTVDMKVYVTGSSVKPLPEAEKVPDSVSVGKRAGTVNVTRGYPSSTEKNWLSCAIYSREANHGETTGLISRFTA